MQVCGGQKTFTTTKHSVLNAVFEEDLQLDVDLAPEDIVAGVCRIAVVDADISTALVRTHRALRARSVGKPDIV